LDAYGQIGPFKDDYDTDVVAIAQAVAGGATVRMNLADRMTKLQLVLARGHAMSHLFPGKGPDALFVARIGHGAFFFALDAPPGAAYVTEKLGFEFGGDGEILADFLSRLYRAMNITVTP
jgi:hypothetical protein